MKKALVLLLSVGLASGCAHHFTPTATPEAGVARAAGVLADCTGGPAATPSVGTASEGAYAGLTLPNGWDAFADEAEVTARVSAIAAAGLTKPEGPEAAAWASFKCSYAPTVAVWQTKVVAPAATSQGSAKQGVYQGLALPFGWDHQVATERDVTGRISEIADQAAAAPTGPGAASWVRFKIFFAPAVVAWRKKTRRAD